VLLKHKRYKVEQRVHCTPDIRDFTSKSERECTSHCLL